MMVSFRLINIILVLGSCISLNAQNFSEANEDNSFFIEEAYNQEQGVVQHIFNVLYFPKPGKEIEFSFTQEWPLFGQTHQISYTIPVTGTTSSEGLGDISINYRYQLTGHDDFITTAPTVSFILPTGDNTAGFGTGRVGIRFNLPLSKRLSNAFAVHFNLGYAITPNVPRYHGFIIPDDLLKDEKANLQVYSVGASLIWLASYNVNFMFEYILSSANDFSPGGGTEFSIEHIFNPGVRFAIDVGNLQIVPGISVPIRIDKVLSTAGIFTYLSFEHPF